MGMCVGDGIFPGYLTFVVYTFLRRDDGKDN